MVPCARCPCPIETLATCCALIRTILRRIFHICYDAVPLWSILQRYLNARRPWPREVLAFVSLRRYLSTECFHIGSLATSHANSYLTVRVDATPQSGRHPSRLGCISVVDESVAIAWSRHALPRHTSVTHTALSRSIPRLLHESPRERERRSLGPIVFHHCSRESLCGNMC
jgi:hypothetical protein